MTVYLETDSVAHVMEWNDSEWSSICRVKITVRPQDYPNADSGWPIWHVWTLWGGAGSQPTKPWCRWCVERVKRSVQEAVGSVLIPAGFSFAEVVNSDG